MEGLHESNSNTFARDYAGPCLCGQWIKRKINKFRRTNTSVQIYQGSVYLSDKLKVPGTNKTFAQRKDSKKDKEAMNYPLNAMLLIVAYQQLKETE